MGSFELGTTAFGLNTSLTKATAKAKNGLQSLRVPTGAPVRTKAALFTEEQLISAPSRLKIPNVKVNYVEDLTDSRGAYGLFENGEIFGFEPNFTRGIIRHEYAHMRYDAFSPRLSSLYFRSNVAQVAEEFAVHSYATGNVLKGLQLSGRYINPV